MWMFCLRSLARESGWLFTWQVARRGNVLFPATAAPAA
jgi:hypothetical protein